MNSFLNYLAIGSAVLSIIPALTVQVRSPSTLDANTVWFEVSMVLQAIQQATKTTVNMAIARAIVDSAVNIIKTAGGHPQA